MRKKIKYTDGPKMDNAKIIEDFLPRPDKLLFQKDLSYRTKKRIPPIPKSQFPIQSHMKSYSSVWSNSDTHSDVFW